MNEGRPQFRPATRGAGEKNLAVAGLGGGRFFSPWAPRRLSQKQARGRAPLTCHDAMVRPQGFEPWALGLKEFISAKTPYEPFVTIRNISAGQ
ncbi:hypothetical protein H6A23_06955 [Olsenella uli]|uniref:hypothetical protein n=1 Tax=Olsenella uli TaxID=133926 RepID=UPI00195B2BDF|nr:hypothetical protein [Olsenella uli]MBM6816902.1 hypothetical protein [Olsenella uli]